MANYFDDGEVCDQLIAVVEERPIMEVAVENAVDNAMPMLAMAVAAEMFDLRIPPGENEDFLLLSVLIGLMIDFIGGCQEYSPVQKKRLQDDLIGAISKHLPNLQRIV